MSKNKVIYKINFILHSHKQTLDQDPPKTCAHVSERLCWILLILVSWCWTGNSHQTLAVCSLYWSIHLCVCVCVCGCGCVCVTCSGVYVSAVSASRIINWHPGNKNVLFGAFSLFTVPYSVTVLQVWPVVVIVVVVVVVAVEVSRSAELARDS